MLSLGDAQTPHRVHCGAAQLSRLARYADRQCERHSGEPVGADRAFHRPAHRQRRQGRPHPPCRRRAAESGKGHRRSWPDASARPDRRAWSRHGPRLQRAAFEPGRHEFARGPQGAAAHLCGGASRCALDHRLRLEPGAVAGEALPDRGRPRCRGSGPARRARTGRWPCRGREQCGDQSGRSHQCDGRAGRWAHRERPVRRCRPRTHRQGHSSTNHSGPRPVRWPRHRRSFLDSASPASVR